MISCSYILIVVKRRNRVNNPDSKKKDSLLKNCPHMNSKSCLMSNMWNFLRKKVLLKQKDHFNVSYIMTTTQSKMHAGIKIATLYSYANN